MTGVGVGLLGFALWFLWTSWGRAFQVAIALTAVSIGIAMIRYPRIGLAVLGFLLLSNIANFIPGSTTLFFAGMLILILARKLLDGDLTWGGSSFLIVSIVFITYYQSTILWVEQDNYYNFHLVYRVLLCLIVAHELFRSIGDFRPFFWGAAAGMIFTSVSAIRSAYSFYTSGVASQIAGSVTKIEGSRFFGHWPDPNIMAFTLAFFLGGTLALWRCRQTRPLEKLLYFAASGLSVAAIGISLSRAGMISAFITIFLVLLVDKHRVYLFSIIGLLLLLVFSIVPTDIFGRLATLFTGDASTGERSQLVINGFKIFLENPFWGAGMGGYEHKILWQLTYLTHGVFAHNTIVDVLVDGGLVGLILFFVCLWYAGRGLSWSSWNVDNSDVTAMLNAGLRASFVGALFTVATFSAVAYVPLWILLFLCGTFGHIAVNQNAAMVVVRR